MEDSSSPYLLKSLPTVLLAVILLPGHSTGLECGWAMTPDKKIIPHINQSGVEIRNVTTLGQCQSVCVNRSEFLCHSINYNRESQTCVLSAENLQTANQTAEIGWMSGERPACQGVWLPWTATRGMILSGSGEQGVTFDHSVTEKCTTRCQQHLECHSVTLEVEGGKCELWKTREGGEGVELQQSDQWQTFNVPLWYLDDSAATTGTKEDIQALTEGGTAIQLFTYLTLPVDGYLIGWKYFSVRRDREACTSYADIWRKTLEGENPSWQLISQTKLEPENSAVGIRFQYVTELVHVRAEDFVGTHVDFSQVDMNNGEPVGCQGNRVPFNTTGQLTPVVPAEKLKGSGIQNLVAGQQINIHGGHVQHGERTPPAMRAYILPYANFISVEIQHIGSEVKISWEVENQKETLPVAGYRLSCSNQSNFTSIAACPAPASHLITSKDVIFTPPTSTQPVYMRVQIVRNINGREEADLTYSQILKFCSAEQPDEVQINKSYISRIAPMETTNVSLNVDGLQDDECASKIVLLISPLSNSSQMITTDLVDKSQAIIVEFDLNTEYALKLRVETADGHVTDGRIFTYKTQDAPPSPEDFSVRENLRIHNSVRVTWKPVYYGLRNVTSYQVACEIKNSTFNLNTSTSPAIDRIILDPITEFDITGLRPQVQYTCTVRANIERGYGYSSPSLNFWTKPKSSRRRYVLPRHRQLWPDRLFLFRGNVPLMDNHWLLDNYTFYIVFARLYIFPSVVQELSADLIAIWPDTAMEATVEKSTVRIALPTDVTEQSGAKYRYLQIKVETASHITRRNANSNDIQAELDLDNYNFPNFTVGDGEVYGGYTNERLSPGVYAISVGYRAETESSASRFTVVPGGENITITTPVSDTANHERLTDNVYIAAGIGAVALLAVIIATAVLVSKRRDARKNDTNRQNLNMTTDVIIDAGEYVNMPRNVSQPNSRLAMEPSISSTDGPTINIPELETSPTLPAISPATRKSSVVVMSKRRENPQTLTLKPKAKAVEIKETPKKRASKSPVVNSKSDATAAASSYENVDSRTRILVNKLVAVIVKEKKKAEADRFNQEFQRLSLADDDRICVGRRSENKAKNRFKNITPFDRNRVPLQTSNKISSDYINASYIQGANGRNAFIASQGPKPGTVIDMWRMIVQEKCKVIIMLTDVIEMGTVKCERYWPEEEASQCIKYGEVTVSLTRKQTYSEFCIWTLQYSAPSDERSVNQGIVDLYHFTTWPDHGTPTTAGLLSFRHRVKEATQLDPSSVPLIHCSAGVGRTGTYIGLDLLISQAEKEGYVDVFNCVEDLRCQRPLMVQTQRQYAFLYDVLAEAVTAGHTSFLCSDLSTKLTQWKSNDEFRVQFEKMNLVAQLQPVMTYETAKSVQSLSKNTTDILACDKYRVFLRNPISTDYINAVVVNGYYNKFGYICTENPSADTLIDYWCMVRDESVKAILHLRSKQERQRFWPESRGESASYGGVTITNKGSSTEPTFNITKYSLTMQNGEEMRKIDLVELLIVSGGVPTVKQLVQLCKILDRHVQSDNPPLLVQCSDGCRLSGLFSVVMNLYQRTRLEQEVDVVLEVKLAQRSRPQFFANQEDFELLYDFLEEYLSEFSEYSNFSSRPATNTQI